MIWDSISGVLPGLLPASYRGIGFDVPDISTEPGRRVAEHLFPGVDRAAYDDMGRLPKIVSVTGLIVGDDYVARAKALEAAFERAGPGMLVHPWYGPMNVIALEPALISFATYELRVARLEAIFTVVQSGRSAGAGIPAVTRLLGAVASLAGLVTGLIAASERVSASPVRTRALARSHRIIAEQLGADPVTARSAIIASIGTGFASSEALAAGLTALDTALLAQVPAWIGVSAVAPAAEALEHQADQLSGSVEPVPAVTAIAALAGRLAGEATDAPSPTDTAFLASAGVIAIGTALKLSTIVDHASRDSAQGLRTLLLDAAARVEIAVSALASHRYAGPARDISRSLSAAVAALRDDINEAIGRLPRVLRLTIERETDAFLIANHLYGDAPENLEAGYRSIVARNGPRHPAALPPGDIEALG